MGATATQSETLYAVLGVPVSADVQAIRTAWRQLVQEHHPDRVQGDAARDEATESAARINEAYHTLKDPKQRERYDSRLAYEAHQSPSPAPEPSRPFAARSWSGQTPRPAAQPRPAAAPPPAAAPGGIGIDLRDIVEAIRRHPRILGAVLIAWVAVFGWGLHSMTAGPPDLSSMTDASSPLSISHSAAAGYHQPSFTMNDLRDVAPHPSAPTVAPDPSVAQQQAQALQAAREGARTAAPRRVIVRPQTDGGAPETGPQHVLVVHPR